MLECRDVLIDAALFHAELLEVVCCSFVLSIVDKRIAKIAFEDLPGGHAEGDGCLPCLDLVEPLVRVVSPALNFGSFDKRQKVCALFNRIARDRSSVVHEHESFELSEKVERALAVSIESIGGCSFEAKVVVLAVANVGERH